MLPIAGKRVLQIPHGLALAATAICLALAFTTDLQSRQDRIIAQRAEMAPPQVLMMAEEPLGDPAQRAEKRARDPVSREVPLSLFPWFTSLRGKRG